MWDLQTIQDTNTKLAREALVKEAKASREWTKLPPRDRFLRLLEIHGYDYPTRLAKITIFDTMPHDSRVWFTAHIYPEYPADLKAYTRVNEAQLALLDDEHRSYVAEQEPEDREARKGSLSLTGWLKRRKAQYAKAPKASNKSRASAKGIGRA